MDRSSGNFILDKVIICKACEQPMVFGAVGYGAMDGYSCRNADCKNKATVWSDIVMECLKSAIEILHKQASAKSVGMAQLDYIPMINLDDFLDEDPAIVSEWLNSHFKVVVSPTLDGKGKVDTIDYY